MRELFTNEFLTVESGRAVSGVSAHTRILRILRGRAWVTVEGQSDDYWLFCDDRISLPPGHLVVVEADAAHGRVELEFDQPRLMTGMPLQRMRAAIAILRDSLGPSPSDHCAAAQSGQPGI